MLIGQICLSPPASVPEYTYFQNLVIQAAHFSYPEAFALAGEGVQTFCTPLYCSIYYSIWETNESLPLFLTN
jgi:hypothetical protein